MKFNEFMGALRKEPLKHVYLLSGEEPYYIDLAKERIIAALLPEGNRADSLIPLKGDVDLEELEGMLGTVPLFAERTRPCSFWSARNQPSRTLRSCSASLRFATRLTSVSRSTRSN